MSDGWSSSRREESPLSTVSYPRGFGYGLAAGGSVFLVCSLLFLLDIAGTERGFRVLKFYGDDAWKVLLKAVGFAFYSSHPGAIEMTVSQTYLGRMSTIPTVVYFLVPPAILSVYGYRTVGVGTHSYSPVTAAIQGATIAIGYVVFVVGSVLALNVILGGDLLTLTTKQARLFGVAGIIYPVLFGGIGGLLAAKRATGP